MRKRLLLSVLFACLLVLVSAGTCSAQYSLTDQELTRLEQIFQQLDENNRQLLIELSESKTDLQTARLKLGEYQQDLAALQNQLLTLKTELTAAKQNLLTAQDLLQKANKSLQAYEQEVQSEIRGLKLQRGILIVGLGYIAFR